MYQEAAARERVLEKIRDRSRSRLRTRFETLRLGVMSATRNCNPVLFQAVVFVSAFLIIFSRRPDAILNAQFFAEDGQRWYADAYHFGLRCLLMPDELGGYLHTVPRCIALFTLLFPLSLAPLVMNLCAVAIQILPASFFLSSRFAAVPFGQRLLGSALYFALPNTYEVNANATTIQWHLGLLAFLVLVAHPASGWKWRLFDGTVLLLISLESPIGVLLVPIAAILWWIRKTSWQRNSLAVLVPGAIVQTSIILLSHLRPSAPNGANLHRLISILGGQVFLSSLVGNWTLLVIVRRHFPDYLFFRETIAFVVGLALLTYALRYGPVALKLVIVFAFGVLALSLIRPQPTNRPLPQWELLSLPRAGNRYYYLPSIAFIAALVWIVSNRTRLRPIRWIAVLVFLLLPIGVVRDWQYPPFIDLHFREYCSRFDEALPGTTVVIPINPQPWTMKLTKHQAH